jgi:hypothetical protein
MALGTANATAPLAASSEHPRWHDKALALAAWVLAAGIFGSVGWMAIEPYDPLGAVSLVTRADALTMIVSVLALSAIVSGLATAIVGYRLPDAGAFAAAFGLAVANLRGQTASYLLISVAGPDAAARSGLAWKLAFEGLLWFAAIASAAIVGGVVHRWMTGDRVAPGKTKYDETTLAEAATLVPFLDPLRQADDDRSWFDGLKVTLLSLVAAALIFRILVTGSPWRSIQHGQAYFALFAAFYFGGAIAYRYWQVRSALWGCLAPPLLCFLGYAFAALSSPPKGPYGEVASVPPSSFFRASPIEYVCVGTVAAVAAFWSARRHRRAG